MDADTDENSDLKGLENLSSSQLAVILGFFQSASDNTLLVLMGQDNPNFVTNVNVLGCFPASQVPAPGLEVATYKAGGIKASDEGDVSFAGQTFSVIKVEVYVQLDTYQVYPSQGECNLVVTFTTPKDDTSHLEDFSQFMQSLQVDFAQLQ